MEVAVVAKYDPEFMMINDPFTKIKYNTCKVQEVLEVHQSVLELSHGLCHSQMRGSPESEQVWRQSEPLHQYCQCCSSQPEDL